MRNANVWPWPKLDFSTAASLVGPHLSSAEPLVPLGVGDYCLAFQQGINVVRVSRHTEAAAAIRREACVLTSLAGVLPFPIPHLTLVEAPNCPQFTLHEVINGEVLTRDLWLSLPDLARERTCDDFASFLIALHSIPISRFASCNLERLESASVATKLLETAVPVVSRMLRGDDEKRLYSALTEWSAASSPQAKTVLLHRDIAPGHVLIDPATGALTGVIDFGDVASGDAARDFIFLYEDFGPEILREVVRRYAASEARAFFVEVRRWYVLETIGWTMSQIAAGNPGRAANGAAEVARELRARESSRL
jgi:aminoglycoside 2''-phosphotransferase